MLVLAPCWIIWHFSSGLSNPIPRYILQTSMINSPEKSFLLPVYAKAMARASPPKQPSCVPHRHHVGDRRVLNFLDISATIYASFPADSSYSKFNSLFSEIFQCRSAKSSCCSDDSMSTSS